MVLSIEYRALGNEHRAFSIEQWTMDNVHLSTFDALVRWITCSLKMIRHGQ
ncbi:hypothetical protein [Paenibacillus xylanexedens]|uniref:hypothetical protein n=1 Tax=Paenibacillus xylanexedens TaxID=528191 RepID=UPI003B021139